MADSGAEREQWRSRGGFILAMIGAAVGLGNIWRFSYVAGENGGATFILVYLVCIFLIGTPVVIAELAVGRHSQGDAVLSFRRIAPERFWQAAGALGILGAVLVMSFYFVIAGWALKYFAGAATGRLWDRAAADYGGYFEDFIARPWEPVFWQFFVMALAVIVVSRGIQGGIEKFTRILMPLLALIVVGLALFSVTHEGAAKGLRFLFEPDWGLLRSADIYLAALGQAFFSLSIGMALYLTYGSYLAGHHRIPGAAAAIVAGDTCIAIVAGIAIFPAVFAFGLDPASGPRLVFITLPQIFLAMPAGVVVGALFFFLLSASALSASVSGIEVACSYVIRRFGLRRPAAAAAVGLGIFALGVPASLGYGVWSEVRWDGRLILESVDYVVSNVVLPLSGLLVALFVGWRWGKAAALRESDFGDTPIGRTWLWLLRIAAPIFIALIFLRALGLI
jgi:NSS family neurotransmitter:Na+ symporter